MSRVLITGASGFIGTNLVSDLLAQGSEVLNLDIAPPLNSKQRAFWQHCDIMEKDLLVKAFREFQPHNVIHLAARTDCDENTTVEKDYPVNTMGTVNVLAAVKATSSVTRVIITSSQYVCGPGHTPQNDEDFAPHTVYGESKAQSERITRAAELDCIWTIVRPTNIWGPWHMRYRQEFWRIVKKGLYVHPGGAPVIRSYGYVGNVVWQLKRLLEEPAERVHKQMFYLGDAPADIYDWTNAFSLALRNSPAKKVPRALLLLLGLAGSTLQAFGLKAPLSLSRYRSMTTDYPTSTKDTNAALGLPPFSIEEGVEQTAKWLNDYECVDTDKNNSTVNILGTEIADVNLAKAATAIMGWVESRKQGFITITGAHGIIESLFDEKIKQAHAGAVACMPDGMPLSWFGWLTGHKDMDRVYGPGLMREALKLCSEKGYSSFFYGGAEGVPEKLARTTTRQFEGLKIAGTMSPPFRVLEDDEEKKIIKSINDASPDIVWIGLSTPKQELLMHRWKGRIKAPLMIGVGAAFDFLSDGKSQAPRWIQRSGLEWLFRLCTEPKRLWRRYLFIVPAFLCLAVLQLLGLLRFKTSEKVEQADKSATSLAPRCTILGLLALTTAALLFLPDPILDKSMPINTNLPEGIGEWTGAELFFCQNEHCLQTVQTDASNSPLSCPSCSGTMTESWSLAESRLLPKGTTLTKRLYSKQNQQCLVSIVISGYERVGIHRPQMCLTGQGFTILREDSKLISGLYPQELRIRHLSISQTRQPGTTSDYYYWFTDGTKNTDSHLRRTLMSTVDRVIKGKASRWAYVTIAPLPGRNRLPSKDLKTFIQALTNSGNEQ